jgi:hypothetical protein
MNRERSCGVRLSLSWRAVTSLLVGAGVAHVVSIAADAK